MARWLAADAIKPWQYRSWIAPRAPDFAAKATLVLELYSRVFDGAPLGPGDYVLCSDEKTSIQARCRCHPTLPPGKARMMRVEHEYQRGGALAYLAAWDVHRGKVSGRVGTNVSARVGALLQSDGDAADRARLLLEAMLPLDEERRVEADVWLAFLIRSRVDDTLEELRSKAWTGTRHICRLAVGLRRGVAVPETIGAELPDADLEQWAQHLHVFVDGLALQAVTYPDRLSADDLRAAVHRQLALVAGL